MTPADTWRICYCRNPGELSLEDRVQRLKTIDDIRLRIARRGKRAQDTYIKIIIPQFRCSDVVLVRVPSKYRGSIAYLWGRKGKIIAILTNGESLYRYKLE